MTDNRKNGRYRRRLAIMLGGRIPAVTAEVSDRGFSAELPQVFLPGSKVHGHLAIGERELPFKGEVTWARPGNPSLSVRSRFGVRFTELAPEFHELFHRLLDVRSTR